MDQDHADVSRQPLRGADGRFISERVHISGHPADGPPGGSVVSPSVVPIYYAHDGSLPTRVRPEPPTAPKTDPELSTRSRRRAPLTDDEMRSETINDGGKAALAVTQGFSSPEAVTDPVIFTSARSPTPQTKGLPDRRSL